MSVARRAELAVGDQVTVYHRVGYANYMQIATSSSGEIRTVDEHGIFLRESAQTSGFYPWWLIERVEGISA